MTNFEKRHQADYKISNNNGTQIETPYSVENKGSMHGVSIEEIKEMKKKLSKNIPEKFLPKFEVKTNEKTGHEIIREKTDSKPLKKLFKKTELEENKFSQLSNEIQNNIISQLSELLGEIVMFAKKEGVLLRTVGWQGEETHNHWLHSKVIPILKGSLGKLTNNKKAFEMLSNTPIGILNSYNIYVDDEGNIEFSYPLSSDLLENEKNRARTNIGIWLLSAQKKYLDKLLNDTSKISELKDIPVYEEK